MCTIWMICYTEMTDLTNSSVGGSIRSVHTFLSVLSPFFTQLITKVSCTCIPGARLNQSIECVGNKKASGRFSQYMVGWGLHPAASGNDVRSRMPTHGMPDTSTTSGQGARKYTKSGGHSKLQRERSVQTCVLAVTGAWHLAVHHTMLHEPGAELAGLLTVPGLACFGV